MKLDKIIKLQKSENYKERFQAEYFQLDDRIKKLTFFVTSYRENKLTFKPSCPLSLLEKQLKSMLLYRSHLIERSLIENVDIEHKE